MARVGLIGTAAAAVLAALCLSGMSSRMNRASLLAKPPGVMYSAAESQKDINRYFRTEAILARGGQPVKRHQKGKLVLSEDDHDTYDIQTRAAAAPRFSGRAAKKQLSRYFAQPYVGAGGGKQAVTRVGFESDVQSNAELQSERLRPPTNDIPKSFPMVCS